jgi:hypothetical protein
MCRGGGFLRNVQNESQLSGLLAHEWCVDKVTVSSLESSMVKQFNKGEAY